MKKIVCASDSSSAAPLNPLSEMMVLATRGNTKNLIIAVVETFGPVDEQAVKLAAKRAAASNPQFVSRIREAKNGLRRYFVREHDPSLEIPFKTADACGHNPSVSGLDLYLNSFEPQLDRDWDLFSEPPVEFHCVKLAKDHYVFGPVLHHAIGDGAWASEFGREFLAHYHEIITGVVPDWAGSPLALSSARKRMVSLKKEVKKNYIGDARKAILQLLEKPVAPVGSGVPGNLKQHQVKRVLTKEQTELLGRISIQSGASLVDLLVAGSNMAIDRWNVPRGAHEGLIATSVSVNMRGRFQGFQRQNNSALIFFKSTPEDRRDLGSFTRQIAVNRIRQFRNQMDFKFFQDVSRMNSLMRMAPFQLRRNITDFVMNLHKFSIAVTLLGVMWPEMKNGKPTVDSALTHVGDCEISEVHGLAYKMLSSTPVLVLVYLYKARLNLVMASSASVFTRQEADGFLDLLLDALFMSAEAKLADRTGPVSAR
jgi:hypothetical protein